MKINLLLLALMGATLITPTTALALPQRGDTKECRSTLANPCPASYADPTYSASDEISNSATLYESIQWIGTAGQCTGSSSKTCSFDFTKTSTGTTSWKVGIKVAVTALVDGVGSFVVEANGEYAVTRTDTDTVGTTKRVAGGKTIVPYSYVPRKQYFRNYYGVWEKGPRYKCGLFSAYNCYTYTWNPDAQNLVISYYRGLEAFQTISFKTYANGSLSGLKLEDDN
jgi:hypothetical protein